LISQRANYGNEWRECVGIEPTLPVCNRQHWI
jgi:hypothetical protein